MPVEEVRVPDIGDFESVDVIEVLVSPGDQVRKDDSLLTLESDKATMELPSPFAGVVRELRVSVGDKVSEGSAILTMERDEAMAAEQPERAAPKAEKPEGGESEAATKAPEAETPPPPPTEPSPPPGAAPARKPPVEAPAEPAGSARKPHASPAVRRFARELGVDLQRVPGTGPKQRVLKEDVQQFVKGVMQEAPAGAGGFALPEIPEVDFSQFGEIETQPLSRIQKISGPQLHRNWVAIPHVTQFDDADITELESFRKSQLEALARQDVKLTLLAFVVKAAVATLKRFPQVNASLAPGGQELIVKKYYHIGVAVDTPGGLVVPVIRDADRKGLVDIARELAELSARARERQLTPSDMQGGTFTISSLGGLGGTGFTPIINAPEVAILGVSRAAMRPVYQDGSFVARLILPFTLSYDHRVVDGADAVRFTAALAANLTDLRRMLL
ncbi:MAG: dihydrolipoyllysine-residue acetyltransferase [Gammaproteobacteria bacterium]|jgi:pyruvate dehydrogenase E2 component (dihydrolipoamide acetyltransferase)